MKQPSCMKLYNRALVTWFLFIPIVVLNGIVREAVYKPFVGELAAHQISTVIAAFAFLSLAYFRLRNHVLTVPKSTLFRMGTMWAALTIFFELGLGRFVTGVSWERLLHDYNILAGRIWSLLLLIVLFTPAILKQLLKSKRIQKVQYLK